jgi:hypothetical protein
MPIIGYWIESLGDDQFLAPQEVAEKLTPDMVEKVVGYLRAGKLYKQYRGFSWCRFSCGCPLEQMGSAELTDGYWIWTEGLIHYVEVHRVALPEAFLADVVCKSAPNNNTEPDSSLDFWKIWCAQNRSPAFSQQLMTARQDAQEEVQNALRERITSLQLEYGLSEQICLCAGCSEKALQSKVFCAGHFLGNDRSGIGEDGLWNFFHSFLQDFGQQVSHKSFLEEESPR